MSHTQLRRGRTARRLHEGASAEVRFSKGCTVNLDLYSDRAKQAVQSAQSLALARRHQHQR